MDTRIARIFVIVLLLVGLPASRAAAGGCADDAKEENDTKRTATPILPGQTFDNLTRCFGDDDWFQIKAYPGEKVKAVILFAQSEGNLDLYLRNANGEVVDQSTSPDEVQEVVEHNVTDAGNYYPVVTGPAGVTNAYRIVASIEGRVVSLSIRDAPDVTEGDPGEEKFARFPVTLSRAPASPVKVTMHTDSGTAKGTGAEPDYVSGEVKYTFKPGVRAVFVNVPLIEDDRREADERFGLEVTALSGAQEKRGKGKATILDDD